MKNKEKRRIITLSMKSRLRRGENVRRNDHMSTWY